MHLINVCFSRKLLENDFLKSDFILNQFTYLPLAIHAND